MKTIQRHKIIEGRKKPVKVIQFGEGNFLRGFTDWMIDKMNEKTDFNGGIQIVQPLKYGSSELINTQDGLYHVLLEGIENGQKKQISRLITSVNGAINPYEKYEEYLKLGENPNLEFIVSNTTESGIHFDENDKNYTTVPNSFPAKLTALLHHRYLYFKSQVQKELIILPCELIENNGIELKICVLKYVEYWKLSSDFENWIERHITFCNTLVDRIVPGFPRDRLSYLNTKLLFEDQLIVSAEIFHLWVIEGPQLLEEKLKIKESNLNIIVTDDLKEYRTRKVRILNGAHTAMATYGILNGFKKVNQVIEDQEANAFIKNIIFEEIIPTLDMPFQNAKQYADDVLERFQNPFIHHYLIDISLNSVSKFKVRVLPSLLIYIEKFKQIPEGLATSFAYLIVLYSGQFTTKDNNINDDEQTIAFFNRAWQLENIELTTAKILSNENLWDLDLSKNILLCNFISIKIKEITNTISSRNE